MHRSIPFSVVLAVVMLSQFLFANERRFSYTYESSTLPQGAREIEVWNTYRTDKGFFYRRMDQRVEFEFGITDRLMSSLYLNTSWRLQDENGNAAGGDAASSSEMSISSEWKYKLMDRVADPFGFALYAEATMGLNETELEGKLILDKQAGAFLIAFNAVAEREWESELESGVTESKGETVLEFDLGGAYLIHPSFSLGVEVRNQNEITEDGWEHSALFAGPTLSYVTEHWWMTLTILPQITAFKGATSGNLVLDEHEKVEARLLFSMSL